jgi:hypothetical protein
VLHVKPRSLPLAVLIQRNRLRSRVDRSAENPLCGQRKGFIMPDRNKAKIEQDANRVVSWLADNRAEFEARGINEDSLVGAVEIGGVDQVRAAIDRLENREVVVRRPLALTSPPKFLLAPGRTWPAVRDKLA